MWTSMWCRGTVGRTPAGPGCVCACRARWQGEGAGGWEGSCTLKTERLRRPCGCAGDQGEDKGRLGVCACASGEVARCRAHQGRSIHACREDKDEGMQWHRSQMQAGRACRKGWMVIYRGRGGHELDG